MHSWCQCRMPAKSQSAESAVQQTDCETSRHNSSVSGLLKPAEHDVNMEWTGTLAPERRRLTLAWWRLRPESPRNWAARCPSCQCPSPGRPASWTAAACTPGWSGLAGFRDVGLALWSAAPATRRTGGWGCSPSGPELRITRQKSESQPGPGGIPALQWWRGNSFFPSLTLLQLHATDGTRAVPVVLLEHCPPPLHEVPQRREAKRVDSSCPRLVKHV